MKTMSRHWSRIILIAGAGWEPELTVLPSAVYTIYKNFTNRCQNALKLDKTPGKLIYTM
jgi:hypothetical protein